MIGITVNNNIGVGDAVQFSSLPENYYRSTGKKLVDVSRCWIFDHNPYVIRDETTHVNKIIELWNFNPRQYAFPKVKDLGVDVYRSNAEIWATLLDVETHLIRPRLYIYEDFPFEKRENIYLHIDGKSQGEMPTQAIEHVINKYGPTGRLFQIGADITKRIPSLEFIETKTLWDLAKLLSEARMLIGMDSGPSWIAACYPDVIIKKIRQRPGISRYYSWVPMERSNIHSHWDDRIFQVFNTSNRDIGFMQSYSKI